MVKKRILAGNWKMNLGPKDAGLLAGQLAKASTRLKKTEIWIAPSALSAQSAAEAAAGSGVKVGAQNVHWQECGAFTGENSAAAARELGLSFAIIGHSERRHIFHEDAEESAKRAAFAAEAGLAVIFCVGETLEERDSGRTNSVLKAQMSPLFKLLGKPYRDNLLVAYEPVWAIGAGRTASVAEIAGAHREIIRLILESSGLGSVPILYGGSVAPDNVESILKIDLVGGCLIGGASLEIKKWEAMLTASESL